MKDEIKEILDYLNIKGKKMIGIKQKKLLLDYITNLQEEKDGYKHKFWEEQEQSEYLQDRIKELEQINEEHRKINEEHRKINGELRKTINEAIRFVESMKYCGQEDYFYDEQSQDPCGNDNEFEDSKTKLLNILQGSDE